MKKYTITIVIAAAALLLGLIIGFIGSGRTAKGHEGHAHAAESGEAVEWTCSMHPSIRQPEFGDCPICGMDLIPMENDDQGELGPNAIRMSDAAMALADIRTTRVETGPVLKSLRLNGVLELDERRTQSLSSHVGGRVEKLMVDFTGQSVQKGDVLAWVYSPELVTAQKELFEALKLKDTQPTLLDAAKKKLKNWKLSNELIDEIIASGAPWDNIPVRAESSGIVTGKRINRGDYISRGQSLYRINELSQLWMMLEVHEKDIAWLETGDSVNMGFISRFGERYTGTIDYIDPVFNTVTRVAKVRVNLSNSDGHLKPGMYGTGVVLSELEALGKMPVIPASALMWTGKRSLVYVKVQSDEQIAFTLREVTLKADLGDRYVVSEGLEAGEIIAVSGTFSIDAAAQLSGKSSMMNPEAVAFQSAHQHEAGDMAMPVVESPLSEAALALTLSPEAHQALEPVYGAYFGLKDALVADKGNTAKKELLKLKSALEAVDMSLFSGDAHAPFMKNRDLILMHLPDKKKLSDIERLRAAFEFVSDGMIGLSRSFLPLGEIIYVQYCPMAFNDKGADWISRSSDIKNPYFGASMLRCGEVTDTLGMIK